MDSTGTGFIQNKLVQKSLVGQTDMVMPSGAFSLQALDMEYPRMGVTVTRLMKFFVNPLETGRVSVCQYCDVLNIN
jgi:hypothetical protein